MMKPRSICGILTVFLFLGLSTRGQSVSGVVNSYYQVTAINSATNTITVANASGLSPGVRILLIQMQGASIDASNTANFGNVQAIANAGNYEINTVCGISGNDVLLQYSLLRTYDVSGLVQAVSFPVYQSVTVTDTLKAAAWNAATGTGGVLVLEATDTIYVNSAISATGKGFSGAAIQNFPTPTYDCSWYVNVTDYFLSSAPSPNQFYSGGRKGFGIAAYLTNQEFARGKQANGGGGGNNHNTGGGGGGNYGSGGAGGNRSNEGTFYCHGQSPGLGGLSLASLGYSLANNRIYMGGGGGSGHMNNLRGTPGGDGGGIILLMAGHIQAAGHPLQANGKRAYNALCNDPYQAEGDGGGGGGAGGTILLQAGSVSGSLPVEIMGAAGSNSSHNATTPVNECDGPGGGGGGGVFWYSGASLAPGITVSAAGGANGIISPLCAVSACRGQANGATSGAAGAALANLTVPESSSSVCAPLALSDLLSFRVMKLENSSQLSWEIRASAPLSAVVVERSFDQVHFENLATVPKNGNTHFTFTDRQPLTGTVYYRLRLTETNGQLAYSRIIPIVWPRQDQVFWYPVQPNPSSGPISLNFYTQHTEAVTISWFNSLGALMGRSTLMLNRGQNKFDLSLTSIAPGLCWIRAEGEGWRQTQKVMRVR